MKLMFIVFLALLVSCGGDNKGPKLSSMQNNMSSQELKSFHKTIPRTKKSIFLYKEELLYNLSLKIVVSRELASFKYFEDIFNGANEHGKSYRCTAQIKQLMGRTIEKVKWQNYLLSFYEDGEKVEIDELIRLGYLSFTKVNPNEVYVLIDYFGDTPDELEIRFNENINPTSYHVGFHKWLHQESCSIVTYIRDRRPPTKRTIDILEEYLFDIEVNYYSYQTD